MKRTRSVFAFGLFAFLATALALSFSYTHEAKVLPLLVLLPAVPVAFWNFLAEVRSDRARKQAALEAPGRRHAAPLILAAVGLPLFNWLLGAIIGLPLFLLVYLRWVSGEGWLSAVFSSILAWAVLYGGFEVLMRTNFERGALLNLLLS